MEFFKKQTNFRFMPLRKRWYAISGILIFASLALIAVRGLNLGIDFTGGVVLELSFPQAANLDEVRGALATAGHGDATVQSFGSDRDVLVRLLPKPGENTAQVGQDVLAAVESTAPGVQLRRTEVVGAQIGAELAEQGALAALFSFLLIMAYVAFRFQWKLGVGSIIAALHDPILVLGFFAATQLTFDLPTLAAILAVVGYSLNDTVVVFDRIRERFVMTRNRSPAETIDLAINDTLSRTLMTSVTTLIAVFSLLFIAGDVLRGFSVALAIGVFVGTYSSIFVASSVALDLKLSARDLMPAQREKGAVDEMP
ncbi:MAG: protein translocase subunit SecF [Lysobacterales bacterium]|jgi:preprotein translocase subunit SecF|nr:MAG: protein translocase subunit SecF [Xanthomonadales bacterium]